VKIRSQKGRHRSAKIDKELNAEKKSKQKKKPKPAPFAQPVCAVYKTAHSMPPCCAWIHAVV